MSRARTVNFYSSNKSFKSRAVTMIVLGIIVIAAAALVYTLSNRKIENYKENGKEVSCVVTLIRSRKNGGQTVEGTYIDDGGNPVNARVIRNKRTYVGETFKGLVIAEKPDEVYCLPEGDSQKTANIIMIVVAGVGAILIIAGIFNGIKSIKVKNQINSENNNPFEMP